MYATYTKPQNGDTYDQEYAHATLSLGATYIVRKAEMLKWRTDVFLEGGKQAYNSVQFEFSDENGPVDLYALLQPQYDAACYC